MNKKAVFILLAFLVMPILLMGCGAEAPATPTTDPNLIYTAAAQTADARLTQIVQSTPSIVPATPTPTIDLTQTAVVQTAAVVLTQIATQTLTPEVTVTHVPVPTSSGADRVTFVSDVTIPDGSVLAPGAAFTKTWKLQNDGTTTWTADYSLVFISGEQMGGVASVDLTQPVSPGSQIDISVDLVAPTAPGSYQGYWKMKNASGQFFNDSVYVLITVGSGGANPTTPAGTAVATPTSTGAPSNPITSLSMSVDNPSASECPHTFIFTASFTLNQGATLTYNPEAYSPDFEINLPGPLTSTFSAGTVSLPYLLEFTSGGSGWVRIHVTAPVDMVSNQASFSLTCP